MTKCKIIQYKSINFKEEFKINNLELEKFDKHFGYYSDNLCEEGREVLIESAEKICADENLCEEALKIKKNLVDLSFDFKPDDEFKDKSAQFGAFVYTLAIEDMEKLYAGKNIPRDIFLDTISDLAVWINKHHTWTGEWGLSEYGWFIHHIRFRLFKLGRLQFEMKNVGETEELPPEGLKLDFDFDLKLGDPYLNVHIPRGGRLDETACLESFERAKEFFPKYFNYNFKAFGCFTWLFDPSFDKLLPPDSNILKFKKLFPVLWTFEREAYWGLNYVFVNITKENIKDAPTDTTFRKKLVEHILSGGIMQSGGGYRLV